MAIAKGAIKEDFLLFLTICLVFGVKLLQLVFIKSLRCSSDNRNVKLFLI
jgi:hypothetical protein